MNRILTLLFLRLGTGVICGMLLAEALKTKDIVGFLFLLLGIYLGFRYL